MHLIGQLTMSPWSWDLYCSCTSLPVRCHATRIQDQQQMYHHILYRECSRCHPLYTHHSTPISPSIICIRQEWKRESEDISQRHHDTPQRRRGNYWGATSLQLKNYYSGGRTEEMEMEKEPTTSLLICVVNSALCCTPPQTTLDLWEWCWCSNGLSTALCTAALPVCCCCCCCWWLCGGGGWWLTIKMIPRKYFITLVTTLKIAFGT